MHSKAAAEFAILQQLSDPKFIRAFLTELDEKIRLTSENQEHWLARANLCRRGGFLKEAREAFLNYQRMAGGSAVRRMSQNNVTPVEVPTANGAKIAPIIMIDGFLDAKDQKGLLDYAVANKEAFRDANINSKQPQYDPDKRKTLVFHKFEFMRDHFINHISENIAQMTGDLGLEQFQVDIQEIKITNHVEGGFFRVHTDNRSEFAAAGRAITWLYYFSNVPSNFTGGDLLVFDSDIEKDEYQLQSFTKIAAKPNRLVAFPSWYYHAVVPVRQTSKKFADGRFAIAGHVRKVACKPGR
ncbi:hypothetical protein GCM10023115_24130 [Pontixanthobacter gangjinensis]|uniref:Fe2OG dioxygenase domain-containing protein n=1 Tax=Pontixanthobacter gangjinensis TaxID=1028742 RepID=A0A6I4SPA5_9SPHN|nr:2OG-Fe(II) oxygenase [Pontixanthobacter gangjinensis]MXO57655.1 hypothetical protein [Pontixanthobacter gangjinensis]